MVCEESEYVEFAVVRAGISLSKMGTSLWSKHAHVRLERVSESVVVT